MDEQIRTGEKTGLLWGKKEIQEFLKDLSNHSLMQLLRAGLPVRIEKQRWIAHKENIESFLKDYTNVTLNPDDAEKDMPE